MILCFRKSHCVWLHAGCVLLCTDLDSYGNSWRKYPACWTPINLPGKSCLMVNIMRILWTYPVAIKVLLKSFIYTCVRYDILKMFLIKINDLVQFFINISFTLVNLFQWPQNWWCCETGHGFQWSPGAFWVHSGPMEWWGWCFRDHSCQFYI